MKRYRTAVAAALGSLLAAPAIAQERAAGAEPDSFWSRVTLEAPAYTHHFPHDSDFNDDNWGLFVDVALNRQLSVVAGDFRNSYRRNTAFAAVSWEPLALTVSELRFAFGGMAGLDLNRGYRGFNSAEPFIGALNMRVSAADLQAKDALHRFGLLFTIIPQAEKHGSTAVNLAVTYRLR